MYLLSLTLLVMWVAPIQAQTHPNFESALNQIHTDVLRQILGDSQIREIQRAAYDAGWLRLDASMLYQNIQNLRWRADKDETEKKLPTDDSAFYNNLMRLLRESWQLRANINNLLRQCKSLEEQATPDPLAGKVARELIERLQDLRMETNFAANETVWLLPSLSRRGYLVQAIGLQNNCDEGNRGAEKLLESAGRLLSKLEPAK